MSSDNLDIHYFSSLENSWNRLKNSQLPVYIYGMGDGCLKILSQFNRYDIKCSGIFASDEFVRGQEFHDFKVCRYADVKKCSDDFIIVPAFGTNLINVMKRIEYLSREHTLIMPDLPVFGDDYFSQEELLKRFSQVREVYSLLCDDQSKSVLVNVLSFKITGDIRYLKNIFSDSSEAYQNILHINSNEIYLDLGAYTGDTIAEFLENSNQKYEKIIALEPNVKNYRKCVKNTLCLNNIEWYNAAAWNNDEVRFFSKNAGRQASVSFDGIPVQCRSVDSILKGNSCTYIKYDVEGADKQALVGSIETIRNFSPKICTALYHRPYDILDLPLMLNEINSEYKMYMRQYPYYPCWETNLFCVE